ncbi:MAG: zinc ribbon domain-containing protein [Candidatus Thorarchaeota archaeon]
MSQDISPQYDFGLPLFRKVCLPKRTMVAYFTYAPLVAFIFNLILLPGHTILFPYYLLSILSRGRPPKFLYGWVYFNSAYLYGAIHNKKEVWYDFWCLWYIYFGFIIAFILWIFNIVSVALIFPIFFYIEEWKVTTKAYYRITFGNWKQLVNECPEMRYHKNMEERKHREENERIKEQWKKSKADGKIHDAVHIKVTDEDDEKPGKSKLLLCPTCGEKIDKDTVYCSKCGSYVRV